MGNRKLGIVEGKNKFKIMMRTELAAALSKRARDDRRTQYATLDIFVEKYLSTRKLDPIPEGARVQRRLGDGETRICMYRIEPRTLRLLLEAESLGYSQSYIVEEAVKEGLAT